MKDIITVSKFTMKEMLRRKSFIVTTIIIMVIIILGFNIPNIMNLISKNSNIGHGDKIIISDNYNLFNGTLNTLKDEDLDYKLEITPSTFEQIKNKIENKKIKAGVIVEKKNNDILFRYIVNDTMAIMPDDLVDTLENLYVKNKIEQLGVTKEKIDDILPEFTTNIEQTEKIKGNTFVITIISILLFYAIYFCAYQVSNSITMEKTSKIMETLVTSTSPRTIVLGKTLGIGLVGIIQIIILVITAIVSAKLFLAPSLLKIFLSSSQITPFAVIVMLIFFILGYYLFALIYALTGSTVSKPEDIQSANTPVMFLGIIGFYIAQYTMSKPIGGLTTFACYFPISSPFAMPFRAMMGLASIQDVIISLVILIISILIVAHIAIKIYSNAILNYGTKVNLKDIIKMYKTK